jgi:hypothetical protein
MMSDLQTKPRSVDVGSGETIPLAIDFTNYLSGVETVNGNGSPTAALTDLTDGSSTSGMLSGSPSVASNTVTQIVTGLTAGHKYRLDVKIFPVSGKTMVASVEVVCPY